MTGNVKKKLSLRVKQIRPGEELNVYLRNGCVMEIQIVWMVLMKTLLFTIVPLPSLVEMINLLAQMVDVLIR